VAEPALVSLAVLLLVGVALATLAVMARRGAPAIPPVGRSPAPWIADEVWRYQPRGLLPVGGVVQPEIVAATEGDRARVPKAPVPKGAELPPEGTSQQQRDRLLATPGPTRIRTPVWPMCCERLAVLVAHRPTSVRLGELEAVAGALDQAYLESELASWGSPGADRNALLARGWGEVLALVRGGQHDGEGLAIYQCRACGRMYVGSCGPMGSA
jgi:hypothetical protein